MDQHLEIIGTFFDGERVDSDALRAALSNDEGRAYLIELAAMREIVATPATVASSASGSRRYSPTFLVAAAALALVVGGTGFVMGTHRPSRTGVSQTPPEPTRVLKLESGTNWTEDHFTKGGE